MERVRDFFVLLWYRFTYCRKFGHLTKYSSLDQDHCINCGKKIK